MEREPEVHIGLMWGISEVIVNLQGHWGVSDARGLKRLEETRVKIRRINTSPAQVRYTVKLMECLSRKSIATWLPEVKQIAVERNLSVLESGKLWSIHGKTWDARTRLIVAGNYSSESEAQEAAEEWTKILENAFPDQKNLFWPQVEVLDSVDSDGVVEIRAGDQVFRSPLFRLEPLGRKSLLTIYNLVVGKDFHWEHKENQVFNGSLAVLADRHGGITLVNELPIETYLQSVASSEATPGAGDSFIKAQAIAARSTVLSTVSRHHRIDPFDLCAGDHCQCYYGVDQVDDRIAGLVETTRGMVRVYNHRPADCRYSKSCGGRMESYDHVWGGEPVPYLVSGTCGGVKDHEISSPEELLETPSNAWCNPKIHKYPRSLDHARNTFRWKQEWLAGDLAANITTELGTPVGFVRELRPLTRGVSGRITRLQIIGSDRQVTIRGELNIRKLLAKTHLPSSLFVISTEGKGPDKFHFRGGGWGHGVGMCQLGGIAMAKSGALFERILNAYYPGTTTETLW